MASVPSTLRGAIAQAVGRKLWRRFDLTPLCLRLVSTSVDSTKPVSFLSEAFELKDAWNERLKSPILSKVNIETSFHELETHYSKAQSLNAIDADILLNAINDGSLLNEAEEITHKLRLSADTRNTLDSTHHAFIRLFLQYKPNELTRILHDRLNYGIFPDNYSSVLIMNEYLRQNDLRNAAKVAVLPMLQEDYSHTLTRHLSLYSILRFIFSRQSWEDEPIQETSIDEDDEEIKVRVPFLRNPYFDDHFDLTVGEHLCGKSLCALSPYYDDVPVCNSLRLLGFALHEKWDRLENIIKTLTESQTTGLLIFDDCVQLVSTLLENKSPDEETPKEIVDKFPQFIENLKSIPVDRRISNESFSEYAEKLVRNEVQQCEQSEINSQRELFKMWDEIRDRTLKKALEDIRKEQLMKEITQMKDNMQKEEELLHYFDNADRIDVVIDDKLKIIEKRTYRRKVKGAQIEPETYVPPETKRRGTS